MFKFIGSSVVILGTVSAVLYAAGYWNGSLDVELTDQGRKAVTKVTTKSQETINKGFDSLKESLNKPEQK